MIDPSYLATLRSQLRPHLLLTMVQLDQMLPGWWESQQLLADDLGASRRSLSSNLNTLARKGLIAHKTFLNGAGTFVWWVKRNPTDTPDPAAVPVYVVRNTTRRLNERIPVNGITEWAQRRRIPKATVWDFLGGKCSTLRNRWELVSTPYDLEPEEVAA